MREKFGVSIDEAHDQIFADAEVRLLITGRVVRDPDCTQLANYDTRLNGDWSSFIRAGDRISVRRKMDARRLKLSRLLTCRTL